MDIEIVSIEFVKPGCPTPKHLKTHKLSLLDQFMPQLHIPMLLFYENHEGNNNDTEHRTSELKESLSGVLNEFYPLAGRIKDKVSIDCNDEGVYYVEAKTRHSLVGYLEKSNFSSSSIHKLLPGEPKWELKEAKEEEGYVAKIQVTSFACGGMVIGALVSHMVSDGTATSFFMNSWASFHSSKGYETPSFTAPNYFPQNAKCPNVMTLCCQFLKKGRLVMRRFLFNAEAISKLKAKGSSLSVKSPTRVEVVSSLICKSTASAFKANSGMQELDTPSLVAHAINMRRRASPTFPKSSMGNFIWTTTTLMEVKDQFPELVVQYRELVKNIDSEFVKSLEGEEGFVRSNQVFTEMVENALAVAALPSGVNYIHFTSWCNLGLYDVDFGWGKPTWVSGTIAGPSDDDGDNWFFNMVLLMDTPSGNGIEAWIFLEEGDMIILQQDKDLLAFAILDPNPFLSNA